MGTHCVKIKRDLQPEIEACHFEGDFVAILEVVNNDVLIVKLQLFVQNLRDVVGANTVQIPVLVIMVLHNFT